MRLRLPLVGHEADWSFDSTPAVERWLASRPWSGGTARRVGNLRVDPAHVTPAFRAAPLQFQLRAAADAAPLKALSCRVQPGSGLRTLWRELGLSDSPPAARIVETLQLQHGTSAATVIVVAMDARTASFGDAAVVQELLQEISDLCVRRGLRFSALLVQSADAPDCWDCRVGAPERTNFALLDDLHEAPWRHYLHIRLAWHAGGQWPRCTESADAWEELAFGDDEAVEHQMNAEADRWFQEAEARSPDMVKALNSFLSGDSAAEEELTECGLLWRPPGGQRRQVTPWVARALLAGKERTPYRSNLRTAVVCEPLVRALLDRAFEAEWRLREILTLSPMFQQVDDGAQKPAAHSSARFLPKSDGRLLPQHPWDYLALGELLKSNAKLGRFRNLVDLRNALAHGHPVGWQGVLDLRQTWAHMGEAGQAELGIASSASAR